MCPSANTPSTRSPAPSKPNAASSPADRTFRTCSCRAISSSGKYADPPPSTTSTRRSRICRAIASSCERRATFATNAAGVACVTRVVVTSPVAIPLRFADTKIGSPSDPSGIKQIAPLSVFRPMLHALDAAAESVTSEFALAVRCIARRTPSRPQRSDHTAVGPHPIARRTSGGIAIRRTSSASPIVPVLHPSDTMNTTFRAGRTRRRPDNRVSPAASAPGPSAPTPSAPAPAALTNVRRSTPPAPPVPVVFIPRG